MVCTQLYLQTEGKLIGIEEDVNTLACLQAKGVGIEGEEENPLTDPKTEIGNWGNLFGGLGEAAVGISRFLSSGFEIVERGGKYFIKGGKEIRDILGLPKRIKVSSVMRAGINSTIYKNIQKAFKLNKFLNLTKNARLDKVVKGLGKTGTFLAWGSAVLDVGEDVCENIQNNAPATEIIGDAIGDSELTAGGVAVGSFGAVQGAEVGAAIGDTLSDGWDNICGLWN